MITIFPLNKTMAATAEAPGNPIKVWKKIVAAIVLLFISQLLWALVLITIIGLENYLKESGTRLFYDSIFSTTATILLVLLYIRFAEKRSFYSAGFTKEKAVKNYGLGLLVGAVMITAVFLLNLVTASIHTQVNSSINWSTLLLCGIGFGIQGMSEELLCRGFLMNNIAAVKGVVPAILINSAVFALLHGMNPGISILATVNLFLVGLVFSFLFYLTDNIWLVSGLHSVWNFFLGIVFGVRVSGMIMPTTILKSIQISSHHLINGASFGFEGGLAATLVLVPTLLLCWKYCKRS